jgi:hypothetical protein
MTASTPYDAADYQRISLLIGLNSIDDVIRWADDQIARSDVPANELIDISLGRSEPQHRIETLLRSLVVDHNDTTALKTVLSTVATAVRDGTMAIDAAILRIYNYLQFDRPNDDLYFSFVALEDDFVCIRDGVYGDGDVSVLCEPLLETLDSYCGANP